MSRVVEPKASAEKWTYMAAVFAHSLPAIIEAKDTLSENKQIPITVRVAMVAFWDAVCDANREVPMGPIVYNITLRNIAASIRRQIAESPETEHGMNEWMISMEMIARALLSPKQFSPEELKLLGELQRFCVALHRRGQEEAYEHFFACECGENDDD